MAPARAFGDRILAGATICGGETVGSRTKEKSPFVVWTHGGHCTLCCDTVDDKSKKVDAKHYQHN